MSPQTVAVLGLGSIGMRHAENLMAFGCCVRGFDPNSSRRSLLEKKGGRTFDTQSAALDGAKAAVIAGPNASHLDAALAAVTADCHALIEKPLAHTEVGIDRLIDAASQRNLVVAVAHNMRFHPAVQKVRKILLAGELGNPLWGRFLCSSFLPDWRPDQDYRVNYTADARTGGVLFDVVHEFDLAHYLLGPFVTVAAAALRSPEFDMAAEACADIVLRHGSGAQSNLHLDYMTRPPRRTLEIAGSRGLIELDLIARCLTVSDVNGRVNIKEIFSGDVNDMYRDEVVDFLSAVTGDTQPCCGVAEAAKVLRQVIAARRMSGLPSA